MLFSRPYRPDGKWCGNGIVLPMKGIHGLIPFRSGKRIEMGNSVLYYLNEYYRTISWAYVLIIPLFLSTFLFTGMKKEGPNILSSVNLALGMMGFYLIANFIELIYLFQSYIRDPSLDWGGFTREGIAYILMGRVAEAFLILLFLFSKRVRQSWFLSFCLLLILNRESILFWYINAYRDYLPSPWSVYIMTEWPVRLLFIIVFWVLIIVSYIYLATYNRLPYPSTLFKTRRSKDVH